MDGHKSGTGLGNNLLCKLIDNASEPKSDLFQGSCLLYAVLHRSCTCVFKPYDLASPVLQREREFLASYWLSYGYITPVGH